MTISALIAADSLADGENDIVKINIDPRGEEEVEETREGEIKWNEGREGEECGKGEKRDLSRLFFIPFLPHS